MKHHRKRDLLNKGWQEHEIDHAEKIIDRKDANDIHFARVVFWSALIVVIFGNLIVSLVLIPFLIVLNSFTLYAAIILLAGSVGFLYNLLITDIQHLERKHHITAGILIPLLAIMNMIIMVITANRLITAVDVKNPLHNPFLAGVVFAIAFLIPYFLGLVKEKWLSSKAN
jgi:hypothetical protein